MKVQVKRGWHTTFVLSSRYQLSRSRMSHIVGPFTLLLVCNDRGPTRTLHDADAGILGAPQLISCVCSTSGGRWQW